jgi:Uma2 family endonuclease
MATMLTARPESVADDQCVVLSGIDWKGYSTMLRLRGERNMPRMVYLDGDLFLMSPSFSHERLKTRLGLLVMCVVEELDIPCVPSSQTTLRRRKKRGGVEGDESFYLANEAAIRGKDKISLRTDPPPDLAIEAVYSHGAAAAVEVYRRLKVPEVWICDQFDLTILVLQPNGSYAESEASVALPFLTAAEISQWAHRPQTESETRWLKDLRRWVSETLPGRRTGRP